MCRPQREIGSYCRRVIISVQPKIRELTDRSGNLQALHATGAADHLRAEFGNQDRRRTGIA